LRIRRKNIKKVKNYEIDNDLKRKRNDDVVKMGKKKWV
jgi:hypothetical protein